MCGCVALVAVRRVTNIQYNYNDLVNQTVKSNFGEEFEFKFIIDSFYKDCLIQGLDEIDLTLKDREAIKKFEKQREKICPWVFGAIK